MSSEVSKRRRFGRAKVQERPAHYSEILLKMYVAAEGKEMKLQNQSWQARLT
jgi:hypothetical protein